MSKENQLVWKFGPLSQAADDAKKEAVPVTSRSTGSTMAQEPNTKNKGNDATEGNIAAKKGPTITETVRKVGTTAVHVPNASKKSNVAVVTTKSGTSNISNHSREAPSTSRIDAKEVSKHVRTLRERIYRTGAPVRFVKLLNDVCTSYGVRSLDELGLRIDNVDELRDLKQLEGLIEMQVMISSPS